jgi:hypothetical protein
MVKFYSLLLIYYCLLFNGYWLLIYRLLILVTDNGYLLLFNAFWLLTKPITGYRLRFTNCDLLLVIGNRYQFLVTSYTLLVTDY